MWPSAKSTIAIFLGACAFRLLNTFLVQSFFDPDEYWQTLEPAYCEIFQKKGVPAASLNLDCAGYTWEWKRRAIPNNSLANNQLSFLEESMQGPIRSYLSVLPIHIFYSFLAKWKWDTHFLISQGPKLVMAVISAAPVDVSVWIMAYWLFPDNNNKNKEGRRLSGLPYFCLFCSMASWFNGYTLVRTFSNSLEATLLTISMTLIAPELLGNTVSGDKVPISALLRQSLCFFLGGCSVAMRFSSIAAWVPMGILLALQKRGNNQQSTSLGWGSALIVLVRVCALFGALGIGAACLMDRYFYGFWAIPFLGSFHFNVVLGNSALYGSHPWHWYLSAGIPAITGLWLPFIIWDLCLLVVGGKDDDLKTRYARRNIWTVIATYTLAHSLSGHKEFRFLLPILPLFCLQAGPRVQALIFLIYRNRSKVSLASIIPWLFLLFLPNLITLVYLGLFHQSAPISVNHKIAAMVTDAVPKSSPAQHVYSVHFLTGACHSTPLHSYLHVPSSEKRVQFSTWSLECSPSCRSDPNVLCESEDFAKDPIGFVEKAYFLPSNINAACQQGEEETCAAEYARNPPDFLVTYSDYAMKLQSRIREMGLQEVGRFSHGINGLQVGTILRTGDGYRSDIDITTPSMKEELDVTYRRIQLLGGRLELSIDEMVLYATPDLF